MKLILNYCKGILIGCGAILPGISSGVFCMIFGIYEKLVNSILTLFQNFKKNFEFLFPIVLGCITGILIVSKLLKFLLETYPIPTNFTFLGLILGGLPALFKQANKDYGFRLHYIIFLLTTFFIGILSIKLEVVLSQCLNLKIINQYNFLYLMFSGFLMSVGIVIPGISSSIILMILGTYNIYISAISSLNLAVLFPIGIGILIGSIIFLKVIQTLLNHFYSQTFYAIIGFVLGSTVILYPGFIFNFEGIFSIILFLVRIYN